MISIMVQSKIFLKILKSAGVIAFWVAVWKLASMMAGGGLQLFLPSPEKVLAKWWMLIGTPEFCKAVGASLLRIFEGFVWGVLAGGILGMLSALSGVVYALLSPLMKMIRAVPVVSFIILVFVFFEVDRIPVFICFLMVMPLIWQSVYDGVMGTDVKLLEMSRVYGLGKWKTMWSIRLPQAFATVFTACINGLGLAWKSGVAAEVISAPDLSLGYEIVSAKSDLSYDELFAVTLTVVLLSVVFEMLLKTLCNKWLGAKEEER